MINKLVVVVVLIVVFLTACTKPEDSKRVLEQAGYKNIVITGYAPFSCGEDDTFKTEFSATAPNGQRVKGAVCAGVFKGNTIRVD